MPRLPVINVKSWADVLAFIKDIPPNDAAFRGQKQEYRNLRRHEMKPQIDRCLGSLRKLKSRLRMERAVCQRFREHAEIYLSAVERSYLVTRWPGLVVMQHYGAPTRLLDWTKSPLVGVYFAVADGWSTDGYVYGFKRDQLEDRMRTTITAEIDKLVWGPHPSHLGFSGFRWDRAKSNDALFNVKTIGQLSDWVATFYSRLPHFPRLIAQQGLFTFASKPDLDHWQQLRDHLDQSDLWLVRIHRAAKLDILRRLDTVGLNGETLFPGVDGVGRSMQAFARTWHLKPGPKRLDG